MNDYFNMKRRTLLKAGGALTLSFALPNVAFAQDAIKLPRNLERNPNLASWIRVHADNKITLLIGKVELGQGTVTAAAQCAADELQINMDQLSVISGDTFQGPNERTTAGSGSAPGCLPAVQQAAAEVRQILVQMAADKLGEPAEGLKVVDGTIIGKNGSVAYGDLVDGLDLNVEPTGKAPLIPISQHRYIGQSVPRVDIPAKMTGEAIFVQEMNPDGVVYGAVARPPTYAATLIDADLGAIEAMPGVINVVRNGSFLGVVAEHQDQAWAAANALSAQANWDVKSVLPTHDGIFDWLENAEAVVEKEIVNTASPGAEAKVYERTYHRPYHMHGSIGTSAAIAHMGDDGIMTVHTHSQSVYATATAIEELLGMEEGKVHCIHTQGSGCYGHNLADDAAADAALLAKEVPGRPVKLQYTRAQEHQWEPYGSAMTMKTRAGVDGDGNVVNWNMEIWSTPHSTRPGGSASRLLSGRYVDPPFIMETRKDGGPPNYAAARNGVPKYEFPSTRVATHFVTDMPLRVSATRGLGAFANVFAIESFIDELAHEAGVDPVEYRLRFLKDPRARDVLMKTAEIFGWDSWEGGRNRGRGIGFAQYKNLQAYTAVAVEVQVVPRNGRIRVIRAATANDSGHMVHPDNIANQIEGGVIQSLSWALKEEVKFDDTAVLSQDWASYPILTFSEVPPVEVALIDRPGEPYLGTGEASQGPTGGALANALFDAVGVRVTRLPLTPDRVKQAMDEA
jgi:nicotinate dehydrogenase subunit B